MKLAEFKAEIVKTCNEFSEKESFTQDEWEAEWIRISDLNTQHRLDLECLLRLGLRAL